MSYLDSATAAAVKTSTTATTAADSTGTDLSQRVDTLFSGGKIGSFNLDKGVAGNYWKNPGDIVDYPKPIYGNPYRPDRFSSRTILSTDNIRMREITLGYNVPALKNT